MYSLILTSAGSGSRMNLGYNKMLYVHNGEYIFNYALKRFLKFAEITEVFLVVSENDHDIIKQNVIVDPRIKLVIGGATRQASVHAATKHVTNEYVLVHDGARCFISDDLIKRTLKKIKDNGVAVACGLSSTDSLRLVIDNQVKEALDRDLVYRMQTPQSFATKTLLQYQNQAVIDKVDETDEVGLLLHYGISTEIYDGEETNIKLTTKKDLGDLNELI